MRIVSWNVNGVRAVARKGLFDYVAEETADLLLLQETKARPDQLAPELAQPGGFHAEWCWGVRKGYSGVATWCRREPDEVWRGFGGEERFDIEGRILATRFDDLVVYNIYFPNGGQGEERLSYKLDFYAAALAHFEEQRARGRSLVIAGDFNTAHHPIDLARPQANLKNTGFMPIEREWLDRYEETGLVDSFRHLHPDTEAAYSWWSWRARARERNVGWRLDYHYVTPELAPRIRTAAMLPDVMGSDHCPVVLELDDPA